MALIDVLRQLVGAPALDPMRAESMARMQRLGEQAQRLRRVHIPAQQREVVEAQRKEQESANRLRQIRETKQHASRAKRSEQQAIDRARALTRRLGQIRRVSQVAGLSPAAHARLANLKKQTRQQRRAEYTRRRQARSSIRRYEQELQDLPTEQRERQRHERLQERSIRAQLRLAEVTERLRTTEHEQTQEERKFQTIGKPSFRDAGESLGKAAVGLQKAASAFTHGPGPRAGAAFMEGMSNAAGALANLIPVIGPILGKALPVLGRISPPALMARMDEFSDNQLNRMLSMRNSPHMTVVRAVSQIGDMIEEINRGAILAPSTMELAQARLGRRRASRTAETDFEIVTNKIATGWQNFMGRLYELDVKRHAGKPENERQLANFFNFGMPSPRSLLSLLGETNIGHSFQRTRLGVMLNTMEAINNRKDKEGSGSSFTSIVGSALWASMRHQFQPANAPPTGPNAGGVGNTMMSLYQNIGGTTVGEEAVATGRAYVRQLRDRKKLPHRRDLGPAEAWPSVLNRPRRFG